MGLPDEPKGRPVTPGVSAIVPVHGAARTLEELTARLQRVLGGCAADFEILLVDDGSPDSSWDVVQRLAAGSRRVRGLRLLTNYGQHNALLAGCRAARHGIVITLDDDLQNPPEEIPQLLAALEKDDHDVVYGSPRHERQSPWRNLASVVTKIALRRFLGAETARNVSAFRAFRTQLRDGFAEFQGPWVSLDVLLSWSTRRFGSVVVEHQPRARGASNYTFWKLVGHALNMITGFSVWPLRLASLLGFASAVFGIGVLAWVIGRYWIEGGSVPGFPFLASIVAIFAGVQLFALGVIGEYVGRMHLRSMDRPSFVVRETTDPDESTGRQPGAFG